MTFALLFGGFLICSWALDSVLYFWNCFIIESWFWQFSWTMKYTIPWETFKINEMGSFVIQHLQCLHDRFYLLYHWSSPLKKKKFLWNFCLFTKTISLLLSWITAISKAAFWTTVLTHITCIWKNIEYFLSHYQHWGYVCYCFLCLYCLLN